LVPQQKGRGHKPDPGQKQQHERDHTQPSTHRLSSAPISEADPFCRPAPSKSSRSASTSGANNAASSPDEVGGLTTSGFRSRTVTKPRVTSSARIAAAKAATPPTPRAVTPSPVQNSVRVAVFQAAPEGWVPSANGAIISQIPARVASAATTAPVNLRITAAFLLSR